MKIGYFCNSTNWGNKKEYNQILKEARETGKYFKERKYNVSKTKAHIKRKMKDIKDAILTGIP